MPYHGCSWSGCATPINYDRRGCKRLAFCGGHAEELAGIVRNCFCAAPDCDRLPRYGVAAAQHCLSHKQANEVKRVSRQPAKYRRFWLGPDADLLRGSGF